MAYSIAKSVFSPCKFLKIVSDDVFDSFDPILLNIRLPKNSSQGLFEQQGSVPKVGKSLLVMRQRPYPQGTVPTRVQKRWGRWCNGRSVGWAIRFSVVHEAQVTMGFHRCDAGSTRTHSRCSLPRLHEM